MSSDLPYAKLKTRRGVRLTETRRDGYVFYAARLLNSGRVRVGIVTPQGRETSLVISEAGWGKVFGVMNEQIPTRVQNPLLTAEEAAAALRCSRTTLLRREKSGVLHAIRSGKRRLYRESEVLGLLQPILSTPSTLGER